MYAPFYLKNAFPRTNSSSGSSRLLQLLCVILFLGFTTAVQAQEPDPCVDSEEEYYLIMTSFESSCYGVSSGWAEVYSPECSCVFSGCLFEWDTPLGEGAMHKVEDIGPGTYCVTVTHPNGCILSDCVTVEGPTTPFVEEVVTEDASCSGNEDGEISITPSEDAGPLLVDWTNLETAEQGSTSELSLAALPPGEYALSVSNFIGCAHIDTLMIEGSAPPVLEGGSSSACSGLDNGEAHIEVTGGEPPFEFIWDDPTNCVEQNVLNLAPGSYSVTVTDANFCEYILTDIVVEDDTPFVSAGASKTQVCAGESVMLTAIGGESYSWEPAFGLDDPTASSTMAVITEPVIYEVTVMNADGCHNTTQVAVDIADMPDPAVTTWNDVICPGESTQLIATEASGASFSWSPETGLSDASINAPLASPEETTTYTLTATNTQGCSSSVEITVTVDECEVIGIEDASVLAQFQLAPNPAEQFVNVAFAVNETADVSLRLMNTLGQSVFTQQQANFSGTYQQQIDLSTYPAGLYYVRIDLGKESYVRKLIAH